VRVLYSVDKGYDSDAFVQATQEQGIQAVIPSRSNRIVPRDCDWFVYKKRHPVECFHDLKSSLEITWAFSGQR